MAIHLLKDKPEYISQVADWLYSTFIKKQHPDFSYREFLQVLKERDTYIVLENDICVGTISLFGNDLKKLPNLTPWLAALYVEEQYRKRGYAKELVNFLIMEVKKRALRCYIYELRQPKNITKVSDGSLLWILKMKMV